MFNTRLRILGLAKRHRFPAATYSALIRSTSRVDEGIGFKTSLQQGIDVVALLFAGLGIIFFIAANWQTDNPFPMFAGLELTLIATAVCAARSVQHRTALTLLGLLLIGALLAFFGQHYQSGADLWQMFALWAALGLPLALAARSDAIWCAWIIVAMTGLSLWWRGQGRWPPANLESASLVAIAMTFCVAFALSTSLRRYTGSGVWSFNLAIFYFTALSTAAGMISLFESHLGLYVVALLATACAAGLYRLPQLFDIRALTICALGLDLLIVGGVTKITLNSRSLIVVFGLSALAAIGTLWVTVSSLLALYRNRVAKDKP